MTSRIKLACIGGAVPSLALVAHGCRAPTQVTLELSTNVVCSESRGVDIVVAGSNHVAEVRAAFDGVEPRVPTTNTTECTGATPPHPIGTLVLTPDGSEAAVVVITSFGKTNVSDCHGPSMPAECIVARRRLSFVEHASVTLPIVLDPVCAGVACNEDSTCVGKKCVDSAVDCASGVCTEPGVVAGRDGGASGDGAANGDGATDAADAAENDAANDSGVDSGLDGGDAGLPTGACPATSTCLDGMNTMCGPGVQFCCYMSQPAACTNGMPATCPKLAACCRGGEDCAAGEICCASTATAGVGTRMTCKTRSACMGAGGVPVCSTAAPGCNGNPCNNIVYSASPAYFRCS